jgi:hypothetical protein
VSVSLADSGSQTTSGTTDHTLTTRTAAGTYIFGVDLNSMAAGDLVELTIYKKATSGGTSRLRAFAAFGPTVPAELIAESLPITVAPGGELIFKLKKAAGSNSAFPWWAELI